MQDKASGTNAYMTVKEMGALLGLKKVDSYWLVKKGHFRVISKAGKMWIERDSFEQWYSGQDHYHKVGDLTREDIQTDYYSVRDMMDLLDTALGPLFDAPGIGRDPESGAIILYCILPFASTTPGEFAEAALQFIDLASAFASRLAAMSAADK